MKDLTVATYANNDGLQISVEFKTIEGVVYANANSMADSKKIENWKNSPRTKEYTEAISKSLKSRELKSIISERGRNGGTWIHEKLVLSLARYVSVHFELWCDEQIAKLLKDGKVSLSPSYSIEDPIERAIAWAQEMKEKQEQAEQIEQLVEEVAELEDDAEIGSIWAAQEESITIREFAHRLSAEGVSAGLRTVHQALRSIGWTFRGGRGKKTIYPTQKAINSGYLEKKISRSRTYGDGTSYETFQILVTHKGQEKFIEQFVVFED